jgi:hypothetical protein
MLRQCSVPTHAARVCGVYGAPKTLATTKDVASRTSCSVAAQNLAQGILGCPLPAFRDPGDIFHKLIFLVARVAVGFGIDWHAKCSVSPIDHIDIIIFTFCGIVVAGIVRGSSPKPLNCCLRSSFRDSGGSFWCEHMTTAMVRAAPAGDVGGHTYLCPSSRAARCCTSPTRPGLLALRNKLYPPREAKLRERFGEVRVVEVLVRLEPGKGR